MKKLEKNYLGNIKLTIIRESNVEIESNEILRELNRFKNKFCVLFDLGGEPAGKFSKEILNKYFEKENVVFIVGGSLGVSEKLKKYCDLVLKLSDFTYSHQIFRICSILFIRKILFNL